MPLVRVEVRNEYGLGMPELYKETNREDPKGVLEGVAVAGLVGILRQLGDLAEFAAEVFHGLQEQVLITSSRSHKLILRLHNIEAALPPLEKAILAQRSHLHFAYTAGSQWHTRLRNEQNHFIYSDLPRCVMDSYEECRDPPRLHMLDKFDTGGPGSCFKRYSDPTFFKRASVGFDEAHLQNVPREKKARRSKKKRRWPRHREETHGAPISTHGGRIDFTSPNFIGQTSPSQDGSTFNVPLKSEMEDHLTSFDSRAGSGYIDCIFRPSFSTQSEENEPKELLSSDLKLQHNASPDSYSLNEKSGVVDDNIQNSSLQEHNGPSSSYVTWDEKTEIMEPTEQPSETAEILCTNDNLDSEKKGSLNFRAVDQMDFNFDDEHLPTSVTGRDQPDEIESETDYYMDALNTIESESETDLDCQTKRELQQYSTVNNKDVEGRPRAGHSEDHSINFEPPVPTFTSSDKNMSGSSPKSISPESHMEAYSSLNNGASEDQTNSDLPESNAQVRFPQRVDTSSVPCTSEDIFISKNGDIFDGTKVETIASNELSSRSGESTSQPPLSEKIFSSCESPKPPSATSDVHPVMFWTNGGLLGLEPSKPPDFGLPTAVGQDPVAKSKNDVIPNSSQRSILDDDGHVVRTDIVVNSSKIEQSGDFHDSNSSNHENGHDSNAPNTVTPGIVRPVNQDDPTKASTEHGISSSRIFEFSNRLLVNGFRRQVTLVGDEKLASSVRSDISEKTSMHKAHQTFMGKSFREQYGNGSPIMLPSSPPLEHMRISFQPIDGFETSKLKLKFPDGSNCNESSGDMFPSFQLVPDPAISLHDSASDSDDDTFCRSSPYISDDCRSHHSESNSEQWESSDSPRSKDHGLDDAFFRISSTESASSSLVTGRISQRGFRDNSGLQSPFTEDGVEPSQSGRIVDIPNFDSLDASLNQVNSNSDGKYFLESQFPNEPTPSPPPLPPLEWRGIKPHPNLATEKEDALSEALTYTLDLKLPVPIISQQLKPAPLKQDNFVETIEHTPNSKQPDWQKLNVQKEANRVMNGKMMDEKEDFLQQIRTKSFNLRRTATARPTFTPGGPTNFKVTAILEKANAIRQAVGSDDGEDDDNWSDT